MIPEAPLEQTCAGLVLAGPGWFVLNARDAQWRARSRRQAISFTGPDEWEADNFSPMLGVNLFRLQPGEPNSIYHWETEAEAFFIISGEALLIVEGKERPLKQWDFAYCPPKATHVIVGAGDGPCVGLAMSSRENQQFGPYGEYVSDETAARYGASSPETTQDGSLAYSKTEESQAAVYGDGWLPD